MENYRFHSEGAVYFVTFSIVEWLPVFIAEEPCLIVTKSLNYCHDQFGLRIVGYVIMPTHFHAILYHETYRNDPLRDAITSFRKFTGPRLLDYSNTHLPKCFEAVFREAAGKDREQRCWQPSRHPETIHSGPFFEQKLDYLHVNPCRKGLVVRAAEWRFSSASYWLSDGKVPNDVKLTGIAW